MLTFTINDKQGVELTFDGGDKKLAEQNAGNGATAQDVALGAVAVQALKLMNYKPRMELVNNLIKAKSIVKLAKELRDENRELKKKIALLENQQKERRNEGQERHRNNLF